MDPEGGEVMMHMSAWRASCRLCAVRVFSTCGTSSGTSVCVSNTSICLSVSDGDALRQLSHTSLAPRWDVGRGRKTLGRSAGPPFGFWDPRAALITLSIGGRRV